jgi:hypothetical protein
LLREKDVTCKRKKTCWKEKNDVCPPRCIKTTKP